MGLGKGDTKLEGCPRVIQILVFIFNFIFFVFGIAMIGYGAHVMIKTKAYEKLSDVDYLSSAKLMIAVGVIVTVIAFLGCCGACLLNKCLLMTFFVLMVLVLICEIAVVAVGYAFKDKVINGLEKGMQKKFDAYNGDDKDLTKAIDTLQKEFKCCGANGTASWKDSKAFNGTDNVPDSCCKNMKDGCGKDPKASKHTEGCVKKLENFFKQYLPYIGGIAVGVVVVQILAIIFAMVLFCQAKKSGTFA